MQIVARSTLPSVDQAYAKMVAGEQLPKEEIPKEDHSTLAVVVVL